MEKIKIFIKERNGLAIFSFLLAVFGFMYEFNINHEYGSTVINLTGITAVIMGIVGLIWMKRKKQKGKWFAILGIILGLLAASII